MDKQHLDSIMTIAKELYLRGMTRSFEEAEEIATKWVMESDTELFFS